MILLIIASYVTPISSKMYIHHTKLAFATIPSSAHCPSLPERPALTPYRAHSLAAVLITPTDIPAF